MMFTIRVMKTYPAALTLGFFDVELRVPWLEARGKSVKPVGCCDRLGEFPPHGGECLDQVRQGAGRATVLQFLDEQMNRQSLA